MTTIKDKQKKKCKHEYRAFPKSEKDMSTNEIFYCIYCLEIVLMHFYAIDKSIKAPIIKKYE